MLPVLSFLNLLLKQQCFKNLGHVPCPLKMFQSHLKKNKTNSNKLPTLALMNNFSQHLFTLCISATLAWIFLKFSKFIPAWLALPRILFQKIFFMWLALSLIQVCLKFTFSEKLPFPISFQVAILHYYHKTFYFIIACLCKWHYHLCDYFPCCLLYYDIQECLTLCALFNRNLAQLLYYPQNLEQCLYKCLWYEDLWIFVE